MEVHCQGLGWLGSMRKSVEMASVEEDNLDIVLREEWMSIET